LEALLNFAFYFVIVLCIAAAGGLLGYKLKLPAGGMLGAMIAVIIFQLIFQPPISVPIEFQVVLQLSFGAMMGSKVTKKDMLDLKKLALPAVIMISLMLVLNIFFGIVMYRFSYINIPTALFAAAPGGMVDMAIVSADFGANSGYVALLQLSRIMFILIFMMPFYKKIMRKLMVSEDALLSDSLVLTKKDEQLNDIQSKNKSFNKMRQFCLTAFFACALGFVLWWVGVPAGAIMGAMLGGAGYNVISGKAYFPASWRLPLQILAGVFIGLRMDRESLFNMHAIAVPMIILFICVLVITILTALVIHKLTGLDLFTSLMASTPGGLSEMAILADDLGIDAPKVAVLHMARLMTVIILFPTMLALVIRIIG